ncbi:MAG: PAS domain S-box protein [Deltaproteobacteria bacterium]|nr:PAS domain S-box protein [Deltaproteobacteria bacterium]
MGKVYGFCGAATNHYPSPMADGPSGREPAAERPALPTLQEHLGRVQEYLRSCGFLAFPASETPLRQKLAAFMEEHRDETARIWAETVGRAFRISEEDLCFLAQDMREAVVRWLAHVRNPDDVETYEALREHARGGFIARHPPSRFLTSQLKIRHILGDLLRRDKRDSPDLPELLALLDQALWERVLHITDFFVEAREQELADQHERYRRSLDSAPAILFMVDPEDGVINGSNLVAERQLASAMRSPVGSALWELHPEGERDAVRTLFRETVTRGSAGKENLHLERASKDPLPVDLRTTLITYGDNRIVQAMYVDLSERRRLEFQLIQSEKMAAIGQLAAGIAHEIRNPLGIIMNALYDLAELLPEPTPEVREDLHIARVEMARVQEIINNLLEFSRDSQTEVQAVDLNVLIGRTLKLMNKYLQNSGVRARAELHSVMPCRASENGMRQVLLNLITNAVQAMPEGGELRVRTEPLDGDRVGLSVSDTGVGIPPERLGRIFDPFYTTKSPGEGTGLGLSVVHSVITNAGGTIEVTSHQGHGSTFSIALPAELEASPHEPPSAGREGA